MPSVNAPAKILLTGANGYFAPYAIKNLLEQGFTVVGTVRSTTKGEELTKLYTGYNGRFSFSIVPDITKRDAFDDLIKQGNFDGVAHAASPAVILNAKLEDYLRPAIHGTLNILNSVKTYGPTVKRFVYTSSAAHWNESVLKLVEGKGDSALMLDMYTASKTLAERAAWNFIEENKATIGFDFVTVLPNYILGAPLNPIGSRDQLTSTNLILSSLPKLRSDHELSDVAYSCIHVRDMATLHTAAFCRPDAAGHRILCTGADATWQAICKLTIDETGWNSQAEADFVNQDDALNEEPAFPGVPKGSTGKGLRSDSGSTEWDTRYSRELLGSDFIGIRQMFRETETYYQTRGWSFFV
ncbi:NAD(P)-binding protein [Ceratobasidium sp. AG-I]|nr:NAD(P)-binding protein [Ceratobasidium sp. AG-I]